MFGYKLLGIYPQFTYLSRRLSGNRSGGSTNNASNRKQSSLKPINNLKYLGNKCKNIRVFIVEITLMDLETETVVDTTNNSKTIIIETP
ncbi:30223_t:CDS:2 [Gigaspora margarita]|uniref:30223_t:CDS:1 n=1 Tax=Gigaspora margarita TaxID=4874 RepID=A0ABM8W4K0_GIGMA|nr:30223_t:CDS:2 [Gigaspora margarita]